MHQHVLHCTNVYPSINQVRLTTYYDVQEPFRLSAVETLSEEIW